MAKHYYFFDGYNLIYAEPQFKKLLAENMEEARRQLTEKILNFLGNTENSCGILVFDGPNENFKIASGGINTAASNKQLTIYYGKTADTIIEKLAKELTAHSQITLVSSDNTIYNSILPTNGLLTQIKAQAFWQTIKNLPKTFRSKKYSEPLLADTLDQKTRQKLDQLRKPQ